METRYLRCKKCGEWFETPPQPEYKANGLSSMEKCDKCGKWAIYQRSEGSTVPGAVRSHASG
jgi:NAD-dependent SIR2 family protein deacetylase